MSRAKNTLLQISISEIGSWDCNRVSDWLKSVGLEQLAPIFFKEEIDGELLSFAKTIISFSEFRFY